MATTVRVRRRKDGDWLNRADLLLCLAEFAEWPGLTEDQRMPVEAMIRQIRDCEFIPDEEGET